MRRLLLVLFASLLTATLAGQEGPQRTKVSADGLITERAIIRDAAPDILLTNYKMLDQLLLRHDDKAIWQQSGALFPEPLFHGHYPTAVQPRLEQLAIAIRPDDLATIAQPLVVATSAS